MVKIRPNGPLPLILLYLPLPLPLISKFFLTLNLILLFISYFLFF
jgi:hypothetical protein